VRSAQPAVQAPPPAEVVVHGLCQGGYSRGSYPPGTATPQEVEHGVGDAPGGPLRRAAAPLGGREKRLQQGPLFVGKVGRVRGRMRGITTSRSSGSTPSIAMIACTTLGKLTDYPLQNSFLEELRDRANRLATGHTRLLYVPPNPSLVSKPFTILRSSVANCSSEPRRYNHPVRGSSLTERRTTVLEIIGVGYGRTDTL